MCGILLGLRYSFTTPPHLISELTGIQVQRHDIEARVIYGGCGEATRWGLIG